MDIAWAFAGPAMHKVNWGEKMGPRIREDTGGYCGYGGGWLWVEGGGELGMEWAARFFDFASLRSE